MAVGGLQTVRDALSFPYAENVIDDVEFALLYNYNRSKPIFPLNFRRMCISKHIHFGSLDMLFISQRTLTRSHEEGQPAFSYERHGILIRGNKV